MDNINCIVMKDQFDRIQAAKVKIHNKKFSIYKGVNVIGRNKSATVDVKNLNVSQYHALIVIIDDSQHFISDLNSSNGTYLFGTKLSPFKLYELSNETEIKFGDVVGLYLKMPNTNATIHLESESMDATQSTQNFTQTFYAANTQILSDDSTLNGTTLFKRPHQYSSSRESEDIHEAATQVVDYPLTIPNRFLDDHESSNLIIETVNCDIHDAATQVVDLPDEQPSTSKTSEVNFHEAPTQPAPMEVNIHEMATQVVIMPQEKVNSDNQREESESTQLITPINSENINEIFNNDKSNDSCRNVQKNVEVSVKENSVIEESVIEDSIVEDVAKNEAATLDENSNDSVDFLVINKTSNTQMMHVNNNLKEDDEGSSTLSDSQDIGKPKKRLLRKLSSSEDLSQIHNNGVCNSDSETDIEDGENLKQKLSEKPHASDILLHEKKKNITDSETDIEDDLPQKSNSNRNKIADSDSETDIEQDLTLSGSEDVIKPKILSKKLNFDSDSETDVENNKENNMITEANQGEDSNASEILNDTDCIPPTQDAFANVFDYKNSNLSGLNVNSQNVSSEESFKLGLTELMIDENSKLSLNEEEEAGIDNTNKIQRDNEPSTSTRNEVIEKDADEELHAEKTNEKERSSKKNEDIYLMPTQMLSTIDGPLVENDPYVPKMLTVTEKEPDDNFYLMPTQELPPRTTSKPISNTEKEADDDVYMMPTQQINAGDACFKAPQRFTFKKKATNLDGSLTTILGNKKEEDPYLMETQKINDLDDIYMQPTQKIEDIKSDKTKETSEENNEKNDIYMQPTQQLNFAGPSNENKGIEEDPYMAPTQQISSELTSKSNLGQSDISHVYDMETQKINIDEQSKSSVVPLEDDDVFDQPTQPLSNFVKESKNQLINTVNETSEELTRKIKDTTSSSKREGGICADVPKVKKIKKSDIENLKKAINVKERVDDVETLSQIEAFIKKPLELTNKAPIYGESSGNFTNKEKTETKTFVDSETLSQIEAFIKIPMDKPATRSKKVVKKDTPSVNHKEDEEDRVETLSQIEAFVKQPLETSLSSRRNIAGKSNKTARAPFEEVEKSIAEKSQKSISRTTRTRQSRINSKENKSEEKDVDVPKPKPSFKTKAETSNDKSRIEEKDTNLDKNTSASNAETDAVKRDIDQSFALLEAKSTKTRKSSRITTGGEIKVAVPKNRRSMTTASVAELPKKEDVQIKPSTRRTRKTILLDSIAPISETKVGDRSKHKLETSKVVQKPGESSESEFSERDVPVKIMKLSVTERSKGKGKVIGKTTSRAADSEENVRRVEPSTPSTSKARISTRTKNSESEDTKSSDRESTVNDPSFSTPSRRGRNAVQHESLLMSAERTKRKQRPKVVFTMLDNPQLESYIRQLGGTVVDSVETSTVLVTEHVKRSQKLLSAVGQGKPICSPEWIRASKKANDFLDPWDYILTDKEAESKWNFSLKESLSKASAEKLLSNYTFQLLVSNAVDVLKGAIEACGGKCVTRNPPKNAEGFFVVIATPENRNKYLKIKKQNPEVTVVEPEAIFDGVLRQDLRLGRHLLT